jgi:hypothetical protein
LNNPPLEGIMRRVATALVLLVVAHNASVAQKTIVHLGGVLRYHGDTIWMERDTMVTRAIYRGDTVIKTTWMNDIQVSSSTYLVTGDAARLIGMVDKSGTAMPVPENARAMPLQVVSMERTMLEFALRNQESMARVSAMGVMRRNEPPLFADTELRYTVSSAMRLVQYRDTVRYVRGCPGANRADTTTFVLFKADSVKRVNPERMFGQAMAESVINAMRTALMQEFLKRQTSPLPADLPRAPDGCK